MCARNAKGYENGCLSSELGLSSGSTTTAPDLTLPAQVRTAATPPARPLARRPDWNELVIGARVIERRPASAGPVPFVGPFGSPFAPQFASRLASPAASPFGGAYSDPFAAALTTRLVLAGENGRPDRRFEGVTDASDTRAGLGYGLGAYLLWGLFPLSSRCSSRRAG